MYPYRFSKVERFWLLGIRLLWQYHDRGHATVQLVDRLLLQAGLEARGRELADLLAELERQGADHLYFERFDRPGLTGDESDLLATLKACYLDDPVGADAALGALLPPGRTAPVVARAQRVAADNRPNPALNAPDALSFPFPAAACH